MRYSTYIRAITWRDRLVFLAYAMPEDISVQVNSHLTRVTKNSYVEMA